MLSETLKGIKKRFGNDSIMNYQDYKDIKVDVISTGLLSLDIALGRGGIPKGRITEIFGAEMSGKSTLSLMIMAEAQKNKENVALVDVEMAFDQDYAKKLGVNTESLVISQPNNGEEALEIVEDLVRSGDVGVVVVDSVAALVPKREIEGEMGDSVPADTPVLIKEGGEIKIVSIKSLYKGASRFYGKRYVNRYKKLKSIEVFTANGWKKIKTVFYKRNIDKKPLVLTSTMRSVAITTKDHSLFVDGKAKSPRELKLGMELNTKEIDKCVKEYSGISDNLAWCLGYFCAEGHKRAGTNTCFKVSDTDLSNIELFQYKLNSCFGVIDKIVVNKPKGNRKKLFNYYFSYNTIIAEFMNSCIDEATKEKKVPNFILKSTEKTQRAFLDGYRIGDGNMSKEFYCFYTSSFLMLSGVSYILNNLKIKYRINTQYRKERKNKVEFIISEVVSGHINNPLAINKFISLPAPKFLYDIETEDGTFVGGAGFVVYHNSQMGLQARMMSQAMRKLTNVISKTNTAVIFLNQTRMKLGIMFGSPTTTSGGMALKFYSSIRVELKRGKQIKQDGQHIGNVIHFKVIKNKIAPPFKTCEVDMLDDEIGFSINSDLFAMGQKYEILRKEGNTWYMGDKKLGVGVKSAMENIEQDKLRSLIIEKWHTQNNIQKKK